MAEVCEPGDRFHTVCFTDPFRNRPYNTVYRRKSNDNGNKNNSERESAAKLGNCVVDVVVAPAGGPDVAPPPGSCTLQRRARRGTKKKKNQRIYSLSARSSSASPHDSRPVRIKSAWYYYYYHRYYYTMDRAPAAPLPGRSGLTLWRARVKFEIARKQTPRRRLRHVITDVWTRRRGR